MGTTDKEIFSEYHAVDVCIMSETYFCVILQQDDQRARRNKDRIAWSKFCTYDFEKDKDNRWGYIESKGGWISPKTTHTEFDEFLIADGAGDVFYYGLGKNKQMEKPITNYKSGIKNLKNINGKIFGVNVGRSVYQRMGVDKWKLHEQLKNIPGSLSSASTNGFYAIDGFSESDIYAVGGERDVWHFDGKEWSPLDIGRRPFLCTCVVCAEDGYVYIGGEYGAIARGRDDEWKTYFPEEHEEDFFSIVSYRGRIFAGTEQDTFIIGEDLTPQLYDFEGQIRPIAGKHMYAAYDRLLIANDYNQVAFFDGEKWLDINGCSKLTPIEKAHILEQELDAIEEAEKELEELESLIDSELKK